MPHSPIFTDVLIIIACSLPMILLFNKLGLPSIAGFIVAGVVIGPSGLKFISDSDNIQLAAEIGVVLLLFAVGLEFSLSRLINTPGRLYVLGLIQVVGTIAAVFGASTLLGLDHNTSLIAGFVITVSSTAVVLKGLSDYGQLESQLGRVVVAIAIVQDLAVVPMLMALNILADETTNWHGIGLDLLLALGVLVALFLAARYILPPFFHRFMAVLSSEMVLFVTILVLFGTAWLTSQVGLSLAIGAFVAGLILAETPFYAQVLAEINPFRTLFSSIFFVSIGMLLDLRFLVTHPLGVLGLVVAVLLVKPLIVVLGGAVLRLPVRMSSQGGIYLAQIGEFAFLMLTTAFTLGLVQNDLFQYIIAAAALTLAVTPLLMQLAPKFTWRAQSGLAFLDGSKMPDAETTEKRPSPAVLIVGYGLNGQNLARVLRETGLHYEVLESNSGIAHEGHKSGEKIYYGDATSPEVLHAIRAHEFDTVVLAISDPASTRLAVTVLRANAPNQHIIVRTKYVAEVELLEKLGATIVVPEEFETSLRMFSIVLAHFRVPPHIIAAQIEIARGESYRLLRRAERLAGMDNLQSIIMQRLVEAMYIVETNPHVGKTIHEIGILSHENLSLISILRSGEPISPPYDETMLQAGDIIVLYGSHEALVGGVSAMLVRR